MMMKLTRAALAALCLFATMPAWAEDANLGEGAAVGASTTVLGDAAAETLVSPEVKRQPWWTTLKRAMTGAASGAIAAKTSGAKDGDTKTSDEWTKALKAAQGEQAASETAAADTAIKKEKKLKKKKKHDHGEDGHEGHGHSDMDADGHHPPGWSKGKKTGWGDGDMPPGLMKKKKMGMHHDHDHDDHDHGEDHDD